MFRKVYVVIAVFALLLLSGCAVSRGPELMNAISIDLSNDQLGTIGVTTARYLPQVEVQMPPRGAKEVAIYGAKYGAAVTIYTSIEMIQVCADPGCVILLPLLGVSLAPFGAAAGAAAGALVGAIRADPVDKVEWCLVNVTEAIEKLHMQEEMYNHFLSSLSDLGMFTVTELPRESGPESDKDVSDYSRMRDLGVDTVIEISVRKLTLICYGYIKPYLALNLEIQLRVISPLNNGELYCKSYEHLSEMEKLEVWAAQDSQKLRDEIEKAYVTVAEKAVDELYVKDYYHRDPAEKCCGDE